MDFTHFDREGNAVMVDVTGKEITVREAVAEGTIRMSEECFELVKTGGMKKGDVLSVARIAGIMGAKKTSELIPLCHILNLTKVTVDFEMLPCSASRRKEDAKADTKAAEKPDTKEDTKADTKEDTKKDTREDTRGNTEPGIPSPDRPGIRAVCTVRCAGRTGVEMEALTGVNVALLTIYDMCKAVDRSMEMDEIHLVRKSGGKSGLFEREKRRQMA